MTASAYDLPSMVIGRVLQGVGGGGLLPATLALVADLYPPRRRGLPLGVVGAVQEFGNVLGPLYGAVVLAVGTWRDIFWLNLAGGLVLAAVVRRVGARHLTSRFAVRPGRRLDLWAALLAVCVVAGVLLLMARPRPLVEDVVLGAPFVPVVGTSRWLSPLASAVLVLGVLFVVRCLTSSHPLLDLRSWGTTLRQVDVLGAVLLATALAGVILAFATADPEIQVFSTAGAWLLAGSVLAALAFRWRNRVAPHPLVPAGTMAQTPAWGAMVVSFFVGSALIAALVDIPIFARITVYGDSQVSAALVLVRFLVGLPVGAFVGGWLTRRVPAGLVTALGMTASCTGFVWMSRWGLESLHGAWASAPLVLGGLGVGLAMAPVNAALLSATSDPVHGVASALLVVSRTVGKLVGISALTTIGLRRYYAAQSALPTPGDVCPDGRTRCSAYTLILREAGLVQLHTIFVGAAVCCVIAGVVALVVFRRADTREVATGSLAGGIG